MSVFGNKKSNGKIKFGNRLELLEIKLKVRIFMIFFKNVNLERDSFDLDVLSELKKWSMQKGYILKITEKKYPIYVSGHKSLFAMYGTRHRIHLHFSR